MSFGEWKSPITLDVVTSKSTTLDSATLDPVTGKLFWRAKKPSGQFIICSIEEDENIADWTPSDFNVVSRVHEYGGGAFSAHNNELYFVNMKDQRLYKQSKPQATPEPLTEDAGEGLLRYACGHFNLFTGHVIIVREDHRVKEGEECVNTIVAIANEKQDVIVSGANFYKDVKTFNNKIIFTCWDHPNMPWDDTRLCVGDLVLTNGTVSVENIKVISSGSSNLQGMFINEESYLYLNDKTNYWNVWSSSKNDGPWYSLNKETGFPYGWVFGFPGYGISSKGIVIAAGDELLLVDQHNPQSVIKDIGKLIQSQPQNFRFGRYANVLCHESTVYVIGRDDSARSATLLKICLKEDAVFELTQSLPDSLLLPYISSPKLVEFQTEDKNMDAYGYFYEPTNKDYKISDSEKPPLLVKVHGGPTGMASRSLSMEIQYFTSRGFAVFSVDYRGSSGYGRAFRRALYGNWGICDIEDAVSCAKHLIKEGLVDGDRVAIDGGSAGGFTTMAAMTFTDFFNAGVSYYGVSDLEALTKFTHKFESRYLDQMIGPLPASADIYKARSPLYHADLLKCPLAFFQGSDDFVCPPPQSKVLYDAVAKNGVPTFYVEFEGEGHGFKKAGTIQRCLSNEIFFYSKIFGFSLADETKNPPPIVNLPTDK